MCKACSMLLTKSNKVYWKAGVDSHDELLELFKKEDLDLNENNSPLKFAKIEISPKNGNYLKINKSNWEFKVDEQVRPEFILPAQEKLCWKAWKDWKEEIYSKINLKEAKNPINPINIKHSDKVNEEEIKLLKEWDSVRASVWDSVWDSVGDSVRASVGDSVWDSVRASVGDSVWAYYGSLFIGIDKWQCTEKLSIKGYPFQSVVNLWKRGLVPSFDGKEWKLHNMSKKAKVIWSGTKKELNNL